MWTQDAMDAFGHYHEDARQVRQQQEMEHRQFVVWDAETGADLHALGFLDKKSRFCPHRSSSLITFGFHHPNPPFIETCKRWERWQYRRTARISSLVTKEYFKTPG